MKILLVEDDMDIRNSISLALEAESFVVDSTADGDIGSYSARTNNYDAIILDVALPKKNGYHICEDIRKNGITTPIIMVSVTSDPTMKVKLLNAGADDYITKPFSFHELVARLRAIIRRPPAITPDVITIHDLSLDIRRQKVTRGRASIYLTRKEFCLLEYLMRHQGTVVSRGMIMEHVWNSDSDPFSNTIEAHILNIRKKIDSMKKLRLIHTIPGRGYKIDSLQNI